MNYLAHAYLSFGHEDILLGNMISDFVKGKQQFSYPVVIQKGILLHRNIDAFTDAHPATKKAKEVFRADYRLYSGAFVDVVYDHFLAIDDNEFSEQSLLEFSVNTYSAMEPMQNWMPEKFKRMFYYMKVQNWLFNYRTKEGLYQSLGGLVKRAAYLEDSSQAIVCFNKNFDFLQECYFEFWKEMKPFAANRLQELLKDNIDN